MPVIRNTFIGGKMSLDIDSRLLPKGQYRKAENIRVVNSEGSDVGAIEKSLSNTKLTALNIGANIYTIASLSDEFEQKIYWAVKSDNGCYLIEYDVVNDNDVFVLEDTRIEDLNILGFDASKLGEMVLIVDSDNNSRFIVLTDNNRPPKLINIGRAKTYGLNGFNEEMILLIKKPPLYSPTIVLGKTISEEETYIEEKFPIFSYRYIYLDRENSALSPFSDTAFKAKLFKYDYSTGTNESMINAFNKVAITINTGSDLVTDIEVIYKEHGSNSLYVIESFNKLDEGWADDSNVSFDFTNSKKYRVLPEKELFRLYDNVPLLAKALAIIQNSLVFGNYTENYDLVDAQDAIVNIDLGVDVINTPILDNIATKSMKSIRDYEIYVSYVDGYGRLTTPLSSENNTCYIPNSNSITQNQIRVAVGNKAPMFAKHYRFFIKQNKTDYESISPIIFYQDGAYRWIKLENSDKDKVREGDLLIVKSDSSQILSELVKVKVLEVSRQEKNFLQPDDVTDKIIEKSGLYFKIKPDNFRLNTDDFENFTIHTYHNARRRYHNVLRNSTPIILPAHFYGDTLNDLVSGGTCTLANMTDKRYYIEIDSVGATDTFKWSDDGTNYTELVPITGSIQVLSNGVEITFGAITGHSILDEWNIYARGKLVSSNQRAYGWFRTQGELNATMTSAGHTIEDEVIENGAVIDLVYDEWNRGDVKFNLPEVSSAKYDNIVEWFYKENIGQKITTASPGFDLSRITFMRGVLKKFTTGNAKYFEYNSDGYMTMVIESQNSQNSTQWVYVRATTTLFQSDGSTRLLFETDPVDENKEFFYEIGRTYDIDANGNHLGFDGSDISQSTGVNAELILPVFNCFAWGNSFESYKIKDLFNANKMKLDTRPSTPIENYRQNKRIASLTNSNVYEQTLNYNALNEFNTALDNYKDLDDRYGSIQKIVSKNTDLDVWQENKVHKVLYKKSRLYNRDGTSNLISSDVILGDEIAYTGEYGISKNPESLTTYGSYDYWTDVRRGVVLRKGRSGIEVISNFGMKDWFRDQFREGDTVKILGGYDPYFSQYVLNINGYTVSFDEKVKGWTSFHSYLPDAIIRLNNRYYTVKDGELYLHNYNLGDYNNFYGVQYASEITTIFNQEAHYDKIFKTIILESLKSWEAVLKTNLTNSTIKSTEFNQRESRWFSHIRKNEDSGSLEGITQGIGNIISTVGLTVTYNAVSPMVSIGDVLYQLNGSNQEKIGIITGNANGVLTIDSFTVSPTVGLFSFVKKNARIEGAEIRGYYLDVTLKDTSTTPNELFGVSSNAVRSYL